MNLVSAPAPAAAASVTNLLPLVSVVIPVRNDARRLAVCLQSLLAVDYPRERFEIVVVDNGSSDDSSEVACAAGARVLAHPGLRVGALRNRGVAAAQGEILAFVDSDHEVPRGWLRAGVNELLADPDLTSIGSPYLAPTNGTWVQSQWELHRIRNKCTREVEWLGTGNLFLRKLDFERIGGFNESLTAAEDVDLCSRLKSQQGRIVCDMRLANTHHGEPKTLWQFFSKEVWRGSSGIRAFLLHGMPWHELPSLLFPLYFLLGLGGVLAGVIAWVAGASAAWPGSALLLLLLPAVLLALSTSWQVRRPLAAAPLTILYLTYGLARVVALFKR